MTATEPAAHEPLRTIADVIAICEELGEQIVVDELDVKERMLEATPTGFPTRSSGADSPGGATNRFHDFGTDAVPDVQLVPQHSDPVGELVARDPLAADGGVALQRAYDAALGAMRKLEECRSHLAKTRRREEMDEQRDRNNCWSCLEIGVRSEVYRDSSPNGVGRHIPRCRKHYDFFLWKLRDAPDEVGVWWAEGRRVSQQMIDAALERAWPARKSKKRKGKRR